MRILVGAIVTAIVGAAMAGWLIARTSAPPSGPVVVISIDSLRADRLGAYGYRRARTPYIDALAAHGIVFDRAYSHSPLTVPAHVSLLSGRLPLETGVRDDEGAMLPAKMPLLPALLHRRGFKTAGIVSSALLGRQTGLPAAFDFFDDEMGQRPPDTPLESVHRDGAETVAVAKRWMEQQGNRFFLFVHLDEPRAPYAPPDRLKQGDPYDGEVARADELVGTLVDSLKARDLYDRAIIVVLSDHGEALGDHGEREHGLFLYDSTLRTPLIVKMPKDEQGGQRRSDVVQHIDIAPTILDLMGAPRPSALRGRSLRHLLDSEHGTLPASPVYAESLLAERRFGWSALASVTDGRYRYVRAPRPELYDLLQDRGELENLAQADPAKLQQLSQVLDKFVAGAPGPVASRLTVEERDALAGSTTPEPGPSLSARVAPKAAAHPAGSADPKDVAASKAGAADPKEVAAPKAGADPKDGLPILEKLRAADSLAAARRYSDAAAAYRDLVAADAGMPAVWRRMGSALLAAGQPKEALDAFREALRLNPEDAGTIVAAASCLAKIGKHEEAERFASVAAKVDAVRGNEELVRVALRRRDYGAAQRAAEAAKQADAGSPAAALAQGVELSQADKYEEALPHLEEAAQLAAARPVRTPEVAFYFGDALAHLKRYSEAEARLSDEVKAFPDNLRAREALAAVYQATGRASDVPALIADLVAAVPTPEGYAAAARIASAAGDKAAAAALRADGRKLFGEAASRAAEGATTR